jgi:hypothetical protein
MSQFNRHRQHVQAIHGHPARPVGLFDEISRAQRPRTIEYADIVEAEEPTLENIFSLGVLAIHPPGEIEQQFVKHALQEITIGFSVNAPFDLVDAPGCPGVHRRIHVREIPFVGRKLAVGVHVPLAQEQYQLLLGEIRVDDCHRHAVEPQIP